MDLDAILEEFRREELRPASAGKRPAGRPAPVDQQAPAARHAAPERIAQEAEAVPAAEKQSQAAFPMESTVTYETLPAEGTIRFETGSMKSDSRPGSGLETATAREALRPSAAPGGPARAEVREKALPTVPARQTGTRKSPSRGLGFALMFLTLLLLAAGLAGILRWHGYAAEEAGAPGPEPVRMELGESLEKLLDERASTSR